MDINRLRELAGTPVQEVEDGESPLARAIELLGEADAEIQAHGEKVGLSDDDIYDFHDQIEMIIDDLLGW